jgi:hypothetical protein
LAVPVTGQPGVEVRDIGSVEPGLAQVIAAD